MSTSSKAFVLFTIFEQNIYYMNYIRYIVFIYVIFFLNRNIFGLNL